MDGAVTPGVDCDVAPAVMTTAAEAINAAARSKNVLFMRFCLLWGSDLGGGLVRLYGGACRKRRRHAWSSAAVRPCFAQAATAVLPVSRCPTSPAAPPGAP